MCFFQVQRRGPQFAPLRLTRTLVDAVPMLDEARTCKTPYELDKLRRANAVAAFGLQALHDLYEAGRY